MAEFGELAEFFESSWDRYRLLGSPEIIEQEASSFAGTKARLLLKGSNSSAFASLSPSDSPDLVADDVEMITQARSELGPELSSVVPEILFSGRFQGRSVAVFELLTEISANRLLRKVQRTKTAILLIEWIDQVGAHTLSERPADQFETHIEQPLNWLATNGELSFEVRAASESALSNFEADPTMAKTVFMHGDLWWGNVMLPTSSEGTPAKFLVIDWGGAKANGYPLYDLVRAIESNGGRNARSTIDRHLSLLGMDRAHGLAHVLCAAGSYGLEGGQLTSERANELVQYCFDTYNS